MDNSDRLWQGAWNHWPDVKLIQCGDGIHVEGQYCTNCFYKSKKQEGD